MADADLLLLPWLRRGAAAALSHPDPLDASLPAVASATAQIAVNGTSAPGVNIRLIGPGHVTALDPRQVVRTDPTPGSRTFEPNYLPLIEFDEPALPWLFTPATNRGARLRPWLCLVVVPRRSGIRLDRPERGSLPILRIGRPAVAADELPDLDDSWAWAHAQLTAEAGLTAAQLTALLADRPERSVSRLICPRVLEPLTEYLACVVPTFDIGRRAGLGSEIRPEDLAGLAPAWTAATPDIELPVYHSWDFATGEGGDFQSLALLLRARPLPAGVGRRVFELSPADAGATSTQTVRLLLGGALQPVDATPLTWPDEQAHDEVIEALVGALNAPLVASPDRDPLLGPPRYGEAQSGLGAVDRTRNRWYEQLNLEPANRATAAFGTAVVQRHQEALVASAWEQAAELRRVNQVLRHLQFGAVLTGSLHQRHLRPLQPDAGLRVTGPTTARLLQAGRAAPNGLAAMLADTGLPPNATGMPLRRFTRPRGAVNRRVARASVRTAEPAAGAVIPGQPARAASGGPPRTTDILGRLTPSSVRARLVTRSDSLVTLERVAAQLNRFDVAWAEATATVVNGVPPRPSFEFDQPTVPFSPPLFPDSPHARAFRSAARAHLARFNPAQPLPPAPALPGGTLQAAFDAALLSTVPATTFAAVARAAVRVPGSPRPDARALDEVAAPPVFDHPMSIELAELMAESILPGLQGVPANTAVPLQTHLAFVESFLAGANTEMGRELLWRGFPPTGTATFFRRFFDARVAPGAPADVDPIAEWGDRQLGVGAGGPDRFVLLVRSELLRRYPNAIVYTTRPGVGERFPMFTGALDPDVRYFGFDIPTADVPGWFVVLQEQPAAPRFGVEVADAAAGYLAPPATDSASAARTLRQMPVKLTIPTSVLLAPHDDGGDGG